MEHTPPLVIVEGLTCALGGKIVLQDVSFTVRRGEIFGVMGLSGAGKSTLLRALMGLIKPQAGHIYIDGADITTMTEAELNRIRLRMGMSFQNAALFDSMNVFDNVAFGLRRRNVPEEEVRQKVRYYLQVVDMEGAEYLMPAELSGGMKKRVAIARALSTEPELVLYDEPTAGLDPILATAIDQLIVKLRNEFGVSSIVVTHDVPHLFSYADRVMMLHEARAIAIGAPQDLRHSDNPFVRQFVTGSPEGPIKV